jgi:iron complex transport system substrate-binding protein
MSLNPKPVATDKPPPSSVRRSTVSLSVLVVIALVCAGGAAGVTAAYYSLTPSASGTSCTGHPSTGNLTILDDLGRCVTAPFDPTRVAVLSPNIMDSVYRLGLRSHVVAVDCYPGAFGGIDADYSPDQIALWNLSASMCVQVGPTFSVEDLANATVQLVLASTIISQEAISEIGTTLGTPVLMLQPTTMNGILDDVTLLGEIFGVARQASGLNAQLMDELANASAIRARDPSTPSVLLTYDADQNGYWTFGAGTFGTSLITLAGAVSISAGNPNPYPELPAETVLADNPAFVVYGTGFGLNESTYAAAPAWSSLPAVVSGSVHGFNSNYFTESDPTMILDGLPTLLAIFHS